MERYKTLRCGCLVFEGERIERCQAHYNENSDPDEEELWVAEEEFRRAREDPQ